MAGTLTLSTLSDGTNSTSSTNPIRGSAKAWVRFDGVTTVIVNASYNVSSVTRNATGYYTINFTNAFEDANYSVSGLSAVGSFNLTGITAFTGTTSAIYSAGTTTSFNIAVSNYSISVYDSPAISISVLR